MKTIKIILITAILCICYTTIFSQEEKQDIHRICEEQKIFEFSQIYKELYYNFANMDNCPEINIDSLYFSYIPKVTKSKNDLDYFVNIKEFLDKFNNGHTGCYAFPDYVLDKLIEIFSTQREEKNKEELSGIIFKQKVFITDAKNDFAYIKLTKCTVEDFYYFFLNNYNHILNFKNLIIDIGYNEGGDGNATGVVHNLLLNQDTIYFNPEKTKTNNSVMKARATVKIHYYEPEEVSQDFKDKYYPYYYNNHFEPDTYLPKSYFNEMPDSLRYKGNIYIIVGEKTVSAGESFALIMSQGEKVKTFGKKTAGAFGQPLVLFFQSGMEVYINTTKTYDYKNNEISTGFIPEYDYDFSEFYKIEDNQEMLLKFIEVIKKLEK